MLLHNTEIAELAALRRVCCHAQSATRRYRPCSETQASTPTAAPGARPEIGHTHTHGHGERGVITLGAGGDLRRRGD